MRVNRQDDRRDSAHGRTAWIYVMPALMDMVLSLLLFTATVRAARTGGSATRVAAALAVWSLVYVVSCPLVGRRVTSGNARRFVLAGCGLFGLTSVCLAATPDFTVMLMFVGVSGLAAALFFPAFQVFMKDVDAACGRSVAYSTGLYTFAWSSGFACGPFAAGFLMQLGAPAAGGGGGPGWRYAFLFGGAVSLLMPLVLAVIPRPSAPAPERPSEPASPSDALPDLAWLGWLGAGAGFAALSIIRAVFPARALGAFQISEGVLGSIFFALSMTQAITGLALMRSRSWMYRSLPVALFALAGILGVLCFGFGGRTVLFVAGAVLFGLYSGAVCFYMVFHAIIHPRRAGRYVAVNESLVGIMGFMAPLIGGVLADTYGYRVPYLAVAGITLAVAAVQACVHARPTAA